jgi:hypothetical protein
MLDKSSSGLKSGSVCSPSVLIRVSVELDI